MSFSDIAVQFDDSEEHIADFWERYSTFKKEQKRKWDTDHKEEIRKKAAEYRENNRDRINAYWRKHRKENPEKYKEVYIRKKQRAEERGVLLNDPEYHKQYRKEHIDHIRELDKQYASVHSDELKQRKRAYYDLKREDILRYHADYYQKNKDDILKKSKEYRESKRKAELDALKETSSFADSNPFRSKYESIVADYLYDSGIKYQYDKSYEALTSDHGFRLRYDFYLVDYSVLIEIDGEQHFHPVCFNGIDAELAQDLFEKTQYHDKLKNDYCAEHGIPLMRIPYYKFKTNEWKEMIDTIIQNDGNRVSA